MSIDARHDELLRQVEQLAQSFESRGFIVTRSLEVDESGLADYLEVSEKKLRNWRSEARGPASRTVRDRVALYPIVEILKWQCARDAGRCVLASPDDGRAESASGGEAP
jgi:hypothetical protein